MMYTETELPYGNPFLRARIPSKSMSSILNTEETKGLGNRGGLS